MDGGAAGRKRKSRFSDAVGHDAQQPPAKRLDTQSASVAAAAAAAIAAAKPAIDPVALAKAAAAKIAAAKLARAVPGGAVAGTPTPAAIPGDAATPVDPAEQLRISQAKKLRTDQIYKSVQEQMSHIKAFLRKPGDAPTAASGTFIPAPLLLDDQGRQIDANGNVIEQVVAPKTTLIANSKAAASTTRATKNVNPYLSHRSVDKEDKLDAVDPRLKTTKRETYVASAPVGYVDLIHGSNSRRCVCAIADVRPRAFPL